MRHETTDIAIVGGGLIGASLALALQPLAQRANLKITLLESHPPEQHPQDQPSFDGRSSALAWKTRLIYEQLGLWQQLQSHAYPIEHIEVSDRGYAGTTNLHHQEMGVDALGYVVSNRGLGQVLWQAMQERKAAQLLVPAQVEKVTFNADHTATLQAQLENQTIALQARLVVLADGGRSGLKQQLGIHDQVHDYRQTALIANLQLARPHGNWAYERFAGDGALALLPLTAQAAALVWTRPGSEALRLAELPETDFLAELQQAFGFRAGLFTQVSDRFAYPLKKVRATEQVRQNLVLLGNAAHYLHPVAGQGYNLAIRGVMSLATWLQQAWQDSQHQALPFHPGDLSLLQAWADSRLQDQDEVIGFSHGLIQLFANDTPLLGHARSLGLMGLAQCTPLRHWITRKAMGMES